MSRNKEKLTNHEIRTSETNNEVGHVKELKPNEVLSNGETRRRSIRKIILTEKFKEAIETSKFKVKHDNNLRCCIKNCNQSKSKKISLYGLPSNKVLRETWITKCNISAEKIKPTLKICGRHFEKRMFKNPDKKCRLIPNAVPTLFLNIDESKTTRLSENTKHTDNNSPNTTLNDKFVSVLKAVHSGVANCFPADNTNSTENLINKVTDETINKTSASSHYKPTSFEQINKKTEDFPSVLAFSNNNGKQQTLLVETTNVINSINMIKSAENPIEELNGNIIDAVTLSSENTLSVNITPQPYINEPMLPIKSTKKFIEQTNSIAVTKQHENSSEGSMSKVTDVAFSTSSSNNPIVIAKQIYKRIESSLITLKTIIDGKRPMIKIECTGKSIEAVNPIDVTKTNKNLTKEMNGTVFIVVPSTSSSNFFAVPSKQTNKNQQMLLTESEPSTKSINSTNVFNLNENSANALHKSTIKFTEKLNNNIGTNVCFQNVCDSVTQRSVKSNTQQTKKVEVDPYHKSKPSLEIIPVELPTTNSKRIKNNRTIFSELPTKQRKQSSSVIDLTENPQSLYKKSKPICLFDDSCKSNSPCTQFQVLNSRHLSDSSPTKPPLTMKRDKGVRILIVKAITTSYNNVQEIHNGHSKVELPDVSWKAVHFSELNVTMFYDYITKKKVVFQNSDNLVPKITIQNKPYSYSKQIKSKNELEKLLVKICCVEICHGYNRNMHPLCIGYFETKSNERCRNCQELVKPFTGTNNQSIWDPLDSVNLMNIRNESLQNRKISLIEELKRFVLSYSENEI